MGREIGWLNFISPREKRNREKKYQQMMFPFGEEQRQKEIVVLKELFVTCSRKEELLFQLIQVKEILSLEDEKEQIQEMRYWWNSVLLREFSKKEKLLFCAMAEKDILLQSLEDFPSVEEIREAAKLWNDKIHRFGY